jgi:hypothetical protein
MAKSIKNPAVAAAAKAGSIKAMPKKEPIKKVPVENISKPATRFFGVGTLKGRGKPKMVEPGSKKEAKLKAKSEWADAYEKKSAAKSKAKTAALKAKGKI